MLKPFALIALLSLTLPSAFGKPIGLKLKQVAPDSIYSKIGLKEGDIIFEVNGKPLDTSEAGQEVLRNLSRENEFTLKVQRGGKDMIFKYQIKEGTTK